MPGLGAMPGTAGQCGRIPCTSRAPCWLRAALLSERRRKALYAETRGAYGSLRIWCELVARGLPEGEEGVQKIMQLHGVKGKRHFKVTTDSRHELPISANLLNREFAAAEPGRVWVGDIT